MRCDAFFSKYSAKSRKNVKTTIFKALFGSKRSILRLECGESTVWPVDFYLLHLMSPAPILYGAFFSKCSAKSRKIAKKTIFKALFGFKWSIFRLESRKSKVFSVDFYHLYRMCPISMRYNAFFSRCSVRSRKKVEKINFYVQIAWRNFILELAREFLRYRANSCGKHLIFLCTLRICLGLGDF